MGVQTGIFAAMWDAIDNYSATKDSFNRKFRSENEILYLERRELAPSDIGSKAAIAIHSQEIDLAMRTNQGMNWPVAMRVDLYTNLGRYLASHDLIEDVIDAIYKAKPTGVESTYIESANCGPPNSVGNVKVVKQEFGGNDNTFSVWNASAVFLFSVKRNPF